MAVTEQLGDERRWHVQLAWYLPLYICITLIKYFIVSVQSLRLKNNNLVSINYMEWSVIPALCALLTGVILKGLSLQKYVFDVCVCMFCFMFV